MSKRRKRPPVSERDGQIVDLARRGMSGKTIREKLSLSISVRIVQHVIAKHLPPPAPNHNSAYYGLGVGPFREYVVECLRRLGKDPHLCEICDARQVKVCDIHHTKYEGCTIYDLQYVCRSCNLSRANKGLA